MGKQKRIVRSAIASRCSSLANQIATMRPPVEVIENSLKEFAIDLRTEGYLQHIRDEAAFRRNKRKTIEVDWNEQKTAIDDRIHGYKSLTNK